MRPISKPYLDNLLLCVRHMFFAHQHHPKEDKNKFRRFDGETPYAVHPMWCAATMATEESIPRENREDYIYTLLFHDLLEDTNLDLPEGIVSDRVRSLVDEMTFSSSEEEFVQVWQRSKECRLLKLYDQTNSFMNNNGFSSPESKEKRRIYILKLIEEVSNEYGSHLNIVKIAKAIVQ